MWGVSLQNRFRYRLRRGNTVQRMARVRFKTLENEPGERQRQPTYADLRLRQVQRIEREPLPNVTIQRKQYLRMRKQTAADKVLSRLPLLTSKVNALRSSKGGVPTRIPQPRRGGNQAPHRCRGCNGNGPHARVAERHHIIHIHNKLRQTIPSTTHTGSGCGAG